MHTSRHGTKVCMFFFFSIISRLCPLNITITRRPAMYCLRGNQVGKDDRNADAIVQPLFNVCLFFNTSMTIIISLVFLSTSWRSPNGGSMLTTMCFLILSCVVSTLTLSCSVRSVPSWCRHFPRTVSKKIWWLLYRYSSRTMQAC